MQFRHSVLAIALAACATRASADDKPAPVVEDFAKRVQDYLKFRQPLIKQMPAQKTTSTSQDIVLHQAVLAESIQAARKDAKQGDIFTPEIAIEFRRLIAVTMASPEGARIRKSLRHAEPVILPVHVNDKYPAKVPLQSTPPSLLLNLPKLPKELDYRLIGRSLALRDSDANIIVDFIPDAVPKPARPKP